MGAAVVKTLGRSGVAVTGLGFGGASIGNLYKEVSDAQAAETVRAAWDVGVRYFDTAPHYGLGLSERRTGAVLREYPRDEYVLSTNVRRPRVPNPDGGGTDDLDHGLPAPGTALSRWG